MAPSFQRESLGRRAVVRCLATVGARYVIAGLVIGSAGLGKAAPVDHRGSAVLTAAADPLGQTGQWWTRERFREVALALGATLVSVAGLSVLLWRKNRALRQQVAERQRAEAELRQIRADLERAVEQRTARLREEVAERSRAEEGLREQQAFVRKVIDAVPDLVFVKDGDDRYVLANQAMSKAVGVPLERLVGMRFRDLGQSPEAVEHHLAVDQEVLRTGQARFLPEEPLLGEDGAVRWLQVTKLPLARPDGTRWLMGVASDITGRKQAEQDLMQAKDSADAANEAKGDFLARMSHEIRTPMNAVIGMTNLLLGTPLDPQQREFAETVHHSGESLLSVINDILDFSKIEAGEMRMESLAFDLQATLDDSLELLAERAQTKGLELGLALAADVPTRLRGDPGRLRQVLLNLVGNAVKFTDRGEVVVEVSHKDSGGNWGELRVAVRDTGVGLTPEAQAELFQPFHQPGAATNRRHGGTGLGLVISRRLVELMGGQIGVENTPGKGATFWFTVRLERTADAPPAASQWPALAGARAFVAGLNPAMRRILAVRLGAWGMVVQGQSGAGAALLAQLRAEMAAGRPCQVVVLDARLEDMDGIDLARTIRAEPALKGVPMVLLANVGQSFAAAELEAAGIVACLSKPAKPGQLGERLNDLFGAEGRSVIRPGGESTAEPGTTALPPTLRLLLAEDNPTNQRLAVHYLRNLGLSPDVAANGLEVLAAFERQPYDFVLMDCHMPEMDGYEATRRLRQDPRFGAKVRIVAVTAAAMTGDRERCLAAGMDDYLAKPLRIEDLREALIRNLPPPEPAPAASAALMGKDQIAHVERAVLVEIVGEEGDNGRRLLADLVGLFLRETPALLERLATQCRDRQFEPLRLTAHFLKGSSASLGAARLAFLCKRLEQAARENNPTAAQSLVAAVSAEFVTVGRLLTEESGVAESAPPGA